MAYDLERLASYVRFYLTVVNQLGAAWENLGRTHAAAKDVLSPFSEPLAPLASPVLAEAVGDGPRTPEALAALFRPEDEEALAGLNDVYEVVGRFSFQGEENKNLGRVQALVSGARNEIVTQRARLADLARIPDQARGCAARLTAEEERVAEAARVEKTAAFEPLAQQVSARADQTVAAMRAVPFPDLSNADAASDEYKRYIGKLDQVYQTCLPFLRKAINNLYGFAGCEPSASWPDTLPLVRELPAELVTVPPADSTELSQALTTLKALGEEELRLGRARDEAATVMARLDGEIAAALVKDKELEMEIATASRVVDFVSLNEQIEAARRALPTLEEERAARVRAAGEVWQRHKKIEASSKLIEEDLAKRTAELAALAEQLTELQGDEPVLFGKDTWRTKVADFAAQIEERKVVSSQGTVSLNQLRIELSAVSVEVQTEETQRGLIERRIEDTQARLAALNKAIRELGSSLGAARPARPVSLAEAQEALGMLQQARYDLGQQTSRLRDHVRANKDEGLRVIARMKQIGLERQHVQAMVESARVAVTQGREEGLRQLAAQRRAAVERHVSEVLGNLEKSLGQVGLVFIEPAREAMLKSLAPKGAVPAAVLESAEAIAPVVEKIGKELEQQLLAQDAALGQIQREFCDVALSACRTAWS